MLSRQITYELTTDEREWMERFFKEFMLDESAIYTLCGTKPMTVVNIDDYTDEEVQRFYENMSEQERKNAVVVEDYDLPLNWKKWEQICSKFPISHYLFFKKEDDQDPKFSSIYFVNIGAAVEILQKNYHIFRQETGLDFDPYQIVFEIQNTSVFWDITLNNSMLMGLLYGFGLKNAASFHEKYRHAIKSTIQSHFSDVPLTYGTASISKFPIPIFASFSEERDEIIEKYKRERKKIQKAYENHDFLDLTLQKLTQS